jgi:hypothetical protein
MPVSSATSLNIPDASYGQSVESNLGGLCDDSADRDRNPLVGENTNQRILKPQVNAIVL